MSQSDYQAFLRSKVRLAQSCGVTVQATVINSALKPHQQAVVRWMVEGGRRACFASFGLGKSIMQLEALRVLLAQVGGRALIVCPLGVRQEFVHDAQGVLGWEDGQLPRFIRSIDEAAPTGIYLTNYETVRDGKLDPKEFTAVSLDEASILRGFGGSKTFREFMRLCTGDAGPTAQARRGGQQVPYRFVATATPSPNDYIELLAYADFLGIMDVSQAKTRFFKRDSTKADVLTLHPHKEREFWLWVASWDLFIQRPSDLGFSDEGYSLPALDVRWHEVPTTQAAPLKTLAALSAGAGVVVNLKRGSRWRESLDLSSIANATVQAYGAGATPIIDGADPVSAWTLSAGRTSVYQSTVTHDGTGTKARLVRLDSRGPLDRRGQSVLLARREPQEPQVPKEQPAQRAAIRARVRWPSAQGARARPRRPRRALLWERHNSTACQRLRVSRLPGPCPPLRRVVERARPRRSPLPPAAIIFLGPSRLFRAPARPLLVDQS